jgi:dephospho-CoA kinase
MIIGLTGGMVCGKRTIAEYLGEKGFKILTFSSDVLDVLLRKRNIPITRTSQQDLGNEIREKEGSGGLARRLILMIEQGQNYVLDGVRNPGEVSELRKLKDFVLIAIDSPQKIRFERIIARNMERDPKTWEEFIIADTRDFNDGKEFGLQIFKCMELADYTVVNDSSLEVFKKRFDEVLEKIGKKG